MKDMSLEMRMVEWLVVYLVFQKAVSKVVSWEWRLADQKADHLVKMRVVLWAEWWEPQMAAY